MTPDWYRGRPMSPHLQVWRWHWTMAASIAHRVTGVGNYLGLSLIGIWIVALALGAGDGAAALISGPLGVLFWIVIYGFSVSVTYHLMNGVRHLVWDSGRGFDPKLSSMVTVAIFAASVVVALILLAVFLLAGGA